MKLSARLLRRSAPVETALDVGCGAGVSTQAIGGFTGHVHGLEPNVSTLRLAPGIAIAPSISSPPLGALNYANLDNWFSTFQSRYPPPTQDSRVLNPEILAASTSLFRV